MARATGTDYRYHLHRNLFPRQQYPPLKFKTIISFAARANPHKISVKISLMIHHPFWKGKCRRFRCVGVMERWSDEAIVEVIVEVIVEAMEEMKTNLHSCSNSTKSRAQFVESSGSQC